MAKAQQVVYGLLAVLGVVLPWRYNLEWMQTAASTSPLAFFEATMVNPAAASISVDIGIVFVAFSVFVIVESRRLGMRLAWLVIPYGALIALASAFPLFLLLRARALTRAAERS